MPKQSNKRVRYSNIVLLNIPRKCYIYDSEFVRFGYLTMLTLFEDNEILTTYIKGGT